MRRILFFLSFLFLNAASAEDSAYQYELRNTAMGNQELWCLHPVRKIQIKLGTVEVWKKGTKLYHWANGTPEQAQAWNESGKIPEKVLENLKIHNIGAAGGGFYASLSPTDSMSYGKNLVVVTLPQDMRVLRTVSRGGANIPDHAKEIEKMKFSAITVNHTRTWVNVVDAKMLTQEFVADENFLRNYRFERLPTPDNLEVLFQRFPELRQDPYYKELVVEVKQLEKDFKSTNREVAHTAALKVIERADYQFMRDLLSEMRPTYVNEEIMNKVIPLMNVEDHLFNFVHGIIYTASKKKELRYKAYQALLRSSTPPPTMHHLLQNVSQKEASSLLSEALDIHGKDLPQNLKYLIEQMKSAGTWKPEIICSKIFAS